MQLPTFQNEALWQQSLTHRSYVNEHRDQGQDNERLEFLGDAVLGFLVGQLLYRRYPQMNEAQLTRLRSALVDEKQLAQVAKSLGVGKLMRLGTGTEQEGGRENPSLLSDCLEAIIGAYFLDAGIIAVEDYVLSLFIPLADQIAQIDLETLIDPKGSLQQWAITHFGKNPVYQVIEETGPPHAKQFTVQVSLDNRVYGHGKGDRKKEAEKQAAAEALTRLKNEQGI